MKWIWDQEKDRNKSRHGIGFDTAKRVFDDPLALSRLICIPMAIVGKPLV